MQYTNRRFWLRRTSADWRARDTAAALLLLALTSGALLIVRAQLNGLAIALIFLIVIVVISLFADRWTSITSSIVAFLLFDFFYIMPFYTLYVAAPDHVLALVVFLLVALVTSQLVYRVRVRTAEALARGRRTEILFSLSQALISDVTVEGILGAIAERVSEVLGMSSCAIIMVDESGELRVRAAVGPLPPLDDRDHAAVAAWALEQRVPAGLGQRRGKYVLPHGSRQPSTVRPQVRPRHDASIYVPIATSTRVIGLLYLRQPVRGRELSEDDRQLLLTFANQVALALERVRLSEEETRAIVLARSDELKSALLSAVSHDLRTPLASIKASVTSLMQTDISWSPADQLDLLTAIDEETDRLTRLISNMLDMTRIEAGELRPQLEWNDPEEVIRDVIRRARATTAHHTVTASLTQDLQSIRFDYVEITQVLMNLVENAGKYAPPGTAIEVFARDVPGAVEFAVADRGAGIPPGQETSIFEKFYRLQHRGGPAGAGIGLSICKGFVEAHGGRIWVEAREGGGSVFKFTLPSSSDDRPAGAE